MATSGVGEYRDAVLLRLIYDATGLATVTLQSAPLIGWAFDGVNPLTPGTVPVSIANMQAVPPITAPVVSPRWAVAFNATTPPYTDAAIFTENEVWNGNFADFLIWLATNNGAKRKLHASVSAPLLKNIWNTFARAYPQFVF